MSKLNHTYPIIVVSLFDGDPAMHVAQKLKFDPANNWRQFTDADFRRQEDLKSVQSLHCDLISLGYRDAALRCTNDRFDYSSQADIQLNTTGLADLDIPCGLEQALVSILTPADILLAPLGIGGHVDHLITLKCALSLQNPLALYAEFPYALGVGSSEIAARGQALGLELREQAFICSWHTWLSAASLYRSQVVRLFAGAKPFINSLSRFADQHGDTAYCRIWCTAAANLAGEPSAANSAGSA